MTLNLWILGILTLLGAMWILCHVLLVVRVLSSNRGGWVHKGLVLLPPLAPLIAWSLRYRAEAVLWAIVLTSYLLLQYTT